MCVSARSSVDVPFLLVGQQPVRVGRPAGRPYGGRPQHRLLALCVHGQNIGVLKNPFVGCQQNQMVNAGCRDKDAVGRVPYGRRTAGYTLRS